jgi:cardiolipin synthase
VYLSPPPFDHAKLLVVDRAWTLFGSTNWDPRSLRLNFELDVECHDPALASQVDDLIAERRRGSRQLTLAELDSRPLPIRLRDGVARLLSPYL